MTQSKHLTVIFTCLIVLFKRNCEKIKADFIKDSADNFQFSKS